MAVTGRRTSCRVRGAGAGALLTTGAGAALVVLGVLGTELLGGNEVLGGNDVFGANDAVGAGAEAVADRATEAADTATVPSECPAAGWLALGC